MKRRERSKLDRTQEVGERPPSGRNEMLFCAASSFGGGLLLVNVQRAGQRELVGPSHAPSGSPRTLSASSDDLLQSFPDDSA